jgi:thiol-disulfide isomerase/thioredoxin
MAPRRFDAARVLELLVNVAILGLCLVLTTVLVKRYLIGAPIESAAAGVAVGARIAVPDVDWQRQPQTIVLALQQGCHFCSESAPFYKRLTDEAARHGVRLVAVFPRDEESAKRYLAELGLRLPELRIADFQAVDIRGTPTVLLANRQGIATHVWRGKLTASREREVLEALAAP